MPKEGEVRANECAPAANEDAKAMMKEVLEQLHDKSEGDSDDASEDEEEGE